jgi:hypothetical protein
MVGVTSFLAVNIKGMFRIDCEAAFVVVFPPSTTKHLLAQALA